MESKSEKNSVSGGGVWVVFRVAVVGVGVLVGGFVGWWLLVFGWVWSVRDAYQVAEGVKGVDG